MSFLFEDEKCKNYTSDLNKRRLKIRFQKFHISLTDKFFFLFQLNNIIQISNLSLFRI